MEMILLKRLLIEWTYSIFCLTSISSFLELYIFPYLNLCDLNGDESEDPLLHDKYKHLPRVAIKNNSAL